VTAFILRRLLGAIPLVLGIATLVFFVVNLAPGDPTSLFFSVNVPPEVQDQLRRTFGLDQPLHVRYVRWLAAFVQGDFGVSLARGRPVADILFETLPEHADPHGHRARPRLSRRRHHRCLAGGASELVLRWRARCDHRCSSTRCRRSGSRSCWCSSSR
jgi:hypothetical protein